VNGSTGIHLVRRLRDSRINAGISKCVTKAVRKRQQWRRKTALNYSISRLCNPREQIPSSGVKVRQEGLVRSSDARRTVVNEEGETFRKAFLILLRVDFRLEI